MGRAIEEFDERWPGIRPVDEELASKIGTIGFHPFVFVRFGSDRGGESDYYVCPTQNELAQFVDELSRLPQLADLKLLRGFERAARGDVRSRRCLVFLDAEGACRVA